MSVYLASLPKQPNAEATTITVSYDVHRASDVEPQYVLKKGLHPNFRTPLSEVERSISDLLTWQEGWDGYEAPEPNHESIKHACSWVRGLYRDVSKKLWIKPHVSADEEGDVVFEWRKGRRKLTVYVSPESVEYVKVERLDGTLSMREGAIGTPQESRRLWNWLTS